MGIKEVKLPKPAPQPSKRPSISYTNWQSIINDPAIWEMRDGQDIICVTPVRTVIRREEEITLIRKIRKVEEIDASPACPTNTNQVTPPERES